MKIKFASRHAISTISALIGFALILTTAQAADPERGRKLYENHCLDCHESTVHIREHRKAGNPAKIREYIVKWHDVLDLPWTAVEVDDVLVYLNSRFYHYAEVGEAN